MFPTVKKNNRYPEVKFRVRDRVIVLSGATPIETAITRIDRDDLNSDWRYWFIDPFDKKEQSVPAEAIQKL